MKNFTDIFIHRPVLAVVLSLTILVVGLKSLESLSLRQYPEVNYPVIRIQTVYPGATADLVQSFVTEPLQASVGTSQGVDYLTSESNENSSSIQVFLRPGYDINDAMVEVTAKVNQMRAELPEGVEPPIVGRGELAGGGKLQFINFGSSTLNAQQITDYIERVAKPLLATVPGIGSVSMDGARNFAIRLWLNSEKMAALGVTATDVNAALQANNFQSGAGRVKGSLTLFNVDPQTTLNNAEQFRQIVVRKQGDSVVHIGDVAHVELGADNYEASIYLDGKRSVVVSTTSASDANPLEVAKEVRKRVEKLQAQLPQGLEARVVFDATDNIHASIQEVITTILEASLIVVVIIFLFLGSLRSVLIPLVTIPLSLVGVAIVMLILGYSINLLTLLAMVLAIGLVVDDAIVVVENIQRHIEEGLSPARAALQGAREIAFPVVAMTITLAAVYLPIGFVGGLTGKLFSEFALTLAGSVIVSGLIALTLSPMMCAKLLKPTASDGFAAKVELLSHRLGEAYARGLQAAINERVAVLVFAIFVLASIGFLYRAIPGELAPPEDDGSFFIYGMAPLNNNINFMTTYTDVIEKEIDAIPEERESFLINGLYLPSTFFSLVLLKPYEERERPLAEVQNDFIAKMTAKIPGLQIYGFNLPSLPGGAVDLPVQYVLTSTASHDVMYEVAQKVVSEARNSGLFVYVSSELRFDKPVLQVQINREKAAELGITARDIGNTLALMLGEDNTSRVSLYGRSYKVIPQAQAEMRYEPSKLNNYFLRTISGQMVPLSTVVSLKTEARPNKLTQFQQLNSTTIGAMPAPGVKLGEALAFLDDTSKKVLPLGFSHDYIGQVRQYIAEGNKLVFTFVLSCIMIYLVLAAQFESFSDPVTMLISVPMSICGALIPMALGLATMNIYTQIGLVTLIGLISKHGILIVDFANKLRLAGHSIEEAVLQAAVVRLRPILMTTAAMVFGVLPLLLATGAGAASRFSIGLVITSGMAIGTLFTLFVVPVMYTFFARRSRNQLAATSEEVLS